MTVNRIVRIHPSDDLIVALGDLPAGAVVSLNGTTWTLPQAVRGKHKFADRSLRDGEAVRMYGVTVGRAVGAIPAGGAITTANFTHATDEVVVRERRIEWTPPDVSRFAGRTFDGFVRSGRDPGTGAGVGTANHWLVVPLVFCENRNIQVMREAMLEELGYRRGRTYQWQVRRMVEALRAPGPAPGRVTETHIEESAKPQAAERVFPHVDGIKFLTHSLGCGGTREDARDLCRLLAAYIAHPNVAGATVLSLGCQNAQVQLLEEALHGLGPSGGGKPVLIFDQQKLGSESTLISEAIRHTFAGLIEANKARRQPAPLSALNIGVKCGGSDGFSGLTANPVIGHVADLIAALGGTIFLAEFPELFGAEQELVDRCVNAALAERFLAMMRDYHARAVAVGSGLDRNPSPGNIADGLITDAMKSAGAVRKGGTSPVTGVLEYAEPSHNRGLNLVCSPGNDVESTTALTAAGANVILFTTGLGTPTGNPICPTLKISTNSEVARRMGDIIDFDTGPILTADASIEQLGEAMLEQVIETASGRYTPKAVQLGQDDFIPWKRGVSL